MRLTGEQHVAASKQRVWEALNDPEILRASIPGCQELEKEGEDRFAATIEVKVGPVGARFKGAVTLGDLNPPDSYTITGEGNAGVVGIAKGDAKVRLSEQGGGTLIAYTVDAEVGGRLAQLGGPVIDATAKQLAAKFFASFEEVVTGKAPARFAVAAPTAAEPSVGAAPSSMPNMPVGWILAVGLAAMVGFLVGAADGGGSTWQGLAIGLLLILVAGAAFEYGRRAAAPVVMLDNALLKRLLKEGQK